jgi:hypothetical protein
MLAGLFVEEMTGRDSVEDAEMVRLSQGMQAIERAHGLGPDNYWRTDEAPEEWRVLNEAWDARNDALILERLRKFGRADLAELEEHHRDELDAMREAGRNELFARRSNRTRAQT